MEARRRSQSVAARCLHFYRGCPAPTFAAARSKRQGQETTEIRGYAAGNPAFPHDSTLHQFFGESQFESYRALQRYLVPEPARCAKLTHGCLLVRSFDRGSLPAGTTLVCAASDTFVG